MAKSLLFASALVLGAAVAAAEVTPKAWVSLFPPPYQVEGKPQIAMTMSCISKDACYIPGGSNGVGFGVFKFDGQPNGKFTPLNYETQPSPEVFNLWIGAGSPDGVTPRGAVGGEDLFGSMLYFVNATTLANALTAFTATTDVKASRDGNDVLILNDIGGNITRDHGNIAMYSTDGGFAYKSYNVDYKGIPQNHWNCTLPSYQAIGGKGDWYLVFGSEPKAKRHHNNPPEIVDAINKNVVHKDGINAILKKDADVEVLKKLGYEVYEKAGMARLSPRAYMKQFDRAARAAMKGERHQNVGMANCPYTAAIVTTHDYGKTWDTVSFNESYWQLEDISCGTPTTCMAVGAGMKQFPGAIVLRTTDGGKTWEQSLFLPSEGGEIVYLLGAVSANPANPMEYWVGGGYQDANGNKALFYRTIDGGKSWFKDGALNFVEGVVSISTAPDGTAFAMGVTQFDDTTIMKYDPNGPPATPAPTYLGNFTEVQCDDDACSVNCTAFSFPQNTCLNLSNGLTAKADCDLGDDVLIQNIFPIPHLACEGPSVAQPQPLNVCIQLQGGGSFYNQCGPKHGKAANLPDGVKPHPNVVDKNNKRV